MRQTDEIWDSQKLRAAKFPKDRIAFMRGVESIATKDAAVFQRYKSGVTPLFLARLEIAKNNYLWDVTEEQFLNEFKLCGYAETQAVEDEDGEDY